MIGVGLIGLGEIGQVHLAGLRESSHVGTITMCDLDSALVEQSRGSDGVAASVQELLDDDGISVIDICLPHHLHAPVALDAIRKGRHVLLEKPMAMSTSECDDIIGAADAAGVTVGVSHNQLFYEPHRRLGDMIASGEIGELRALRARLAIGGKYGAWRSDPAKAGGGLLMDAGVHRIYMMEALGGPIAAVSATVEQPGVEERYAITLEFESGAIGTIDATYHGPDGLFDDQIEAVGTEALVSVTGCEAQFEGFAPGPAWKVWADGVWTEHSTDDDWSASVRASVDSYCAAIVGGEAPPVTGEDGRRTLSVIEAAYESAREDRRIALS